MKWIVFVVLVLCAFAVDAQEFSSTIYRDIYAPAETVQAEILVNNSVRLPAANDIRLRAGNQSVPIAPFISTIADNRIFLSFNLPLTARDGPYALLIEHIPFVIDGVLKELSHSINFSVVKQTPLLSIFPAMIKVKEESDIEITVTNKGQSTSVDIITPPYITHSYTGQQYINEGASRDFKFHIKPDGSERTNITLVYEKTYVIPIFMPAKKTQPPQPQPQQKNPLIFLTEYSSLNRTIEKSMALEGTLTVKNEWNESLEEVKVLLTEALPLIASVSPSTFTLSPEGTADLHITVNQGKAPAQQSYSGNLQVAYKEYSLSFPMSFSFREEVEVKEGGKPTGTKDYGQGDLQLFNETFYSRPSEPKRRITSLPFIVLIVLLAVFFVYLLKRKTVKRQTFSQYMEKIKK